MTEPYKNIPRVLEGSRAAQAVDEIGQFVRGNPDIDPGALEQAVKAKIVQYGGDPVTAAAASRSAAVLAQQDPGRAGLIVENIVGTTLADPNLAASQAAARVDARLRQQGAPGSEAAHSAIAYEEANAVLQASGVTDTQSSQALQQAVDQYLARGATASQAAAAAVVSVLAQAMPEAGSFSIFGYFNMLVHGDAEYLFKNTETMRVTGSAIHSHLSTTTYKMNGQKLHIEADEIKTKGVSEVVRAHPGEAKGIYGGSYVSWTPLTVSGYGWTTQYGKEQHLAGGGSVSLSGLRVYLAIYDSDLANTRSKISKHDDRVTALEAYVMIRETLTSGRHFLG
ncbi:hypothetical protein [Bordetella sp. 15P40C-2]|uniref:hypothetical protein n=1 Tax=Bordetella sp. 15P40C-2 TaxID=2572246 RepID=UPI00132B6885|nr:hypothetical protein [Bordetella sp. 15P40C-2]MVW73599.1 hypothetical protein [Bordetella sp. 15P40C-2]